MSSRNCSKARVGLVDDGPARGRVLSRVVERAQNAFAEIGDVHGDGSVRRNRSLNFEAILEVRSRVQRLLFPRHMNRHEPAEDGHVRTSTNPAARISSDDAARAGIPPDRRRECSDTCRDRRWSTQPSDEPTSVEIREVHGTQPRRLRAGRNRASRARRPGAARDESRRARPAGPARCADRSRSSRDRTCALDTGSAVMSPTSHVRCRRRRAGLLRAPARSSAA